MQVKFLGGKRTVLANKREAKIMREAAGMFAFIWDSKADDNDRQTTCAEALEMMDGAIRLCRGR